MNEKEKRKRHIQRSLANRAQIIEYKINPTIYAHDMRRVTIKWRLGGLPIMTFQMIGDDLLADVDASIIMQLLEETGRETIMSILSRWQLAGPKGKLPT